MNLESLIGLVKIFPNSKLYSDVLVNVFRDYPEYALVGLDEHELGEVLTSIKGRDDAIDFQSHLTIDLAAGSGNLKKLAYYVADKYLSVKKTIGKKIDERTDYYNDWTATCVGCNEEVNALINQSDKSDAFTPERVLYAERMDYIFPSIQAEDGKTQFQLKCVNCGNSNFDFYQYGETIIFRERIKSEDGRIIEGELKEQRRKAIVNEIFASTSAQVRRTIPSRTYTITESKIVEALFKYYRGVREGENPNGPIDYGEAYRALEWLKRQNALVKEFDLDDLTAKILEEEIGKSETLKLPTAVIKMRPKSLESIFRKGIRSVYQIQTYEGEIIDLQDLYGIRFVLPSEEACRTLFGKMQKDSEMEVINFKDFFSNPKHNGYEGINAHIRWKGILYSFQLRTHSSDRLAETDPRQKHSVVVNEQIELIKPNSPIQVRRVFGTILGLQKSPLYSS